MNTTAKNVLFISIDDLNDWVGALEGYGGEVHTPNLDALMARGANFTNAYAQVALCNPSRTSVLGGEHPLTNGVISNRQRWYEQTDIDKTLPAKMKEAGFTTASYGKVFALDPQQADQDRLFDDYSNEGIFVVNNNGLRTFGTPEKFKITEEDLLDFKTTASAVNFLSDAENVSDPYFLQVGFSEPHAQWIVPQEFFDLYPKSSIELPETRRNDLDEVSAFARELIPDRHEFLTRGASWGDLVQAYLAGISYMDSKLGEVLTALEQSGTADETLIVLWSDHGYHLGDRESYWEKFTLWEEAARAPMAIVGPGIEAGTVIETPVELLDIYPTVMALMGQEIPDHVEGRDLSSLVLGEASDAPGLAVTWMYGSYSVRNETFRYIRYVDGSEELYNIVNDPNQERNLAGDSASAIAAAKILRDYVEDRFGVEHVLEAGGAAIGGDGEDILIEYAANTRLEGGAGDDDYFVHNQRLVNGQFRPQTHETTIVERVNGGEDTVYVTNDFVLPANVENLTFTFFDQPRSRWNYEFSGNALGNTFLLADGNDYVRGLGGDDFISLERGNDRAEGGLGDDTIDGFLGDDTIFGGAGDDSVDGSGGNDRVFGGDGADTVLGQLGRDSLWGGDGDDLMFGSTETDFLSGGAGDDTLNGGTHNDTLQGGDGNDIMFGGSGNDRLVGGKGDDVLHGNDGADFLRGSEGEDTLYGLNGDDRIFGGADDDFLQGFSGDDLLRGQGGADKLYGNGGDDTIIGNSGADTLSGGAGNDYFRGGGGADWFFAGSGDDTLEGGRGDDLFFFSTGWGGDQIIGFTAGEDSVRFLDIEISEISLSLVDGHVDLRVGADVVRLVNAGALTLDDIL